MFFGVGWIVKCNGHALWPMLSGGCVLYQQCTLCCDNNKDAQMSRRWQLVLDI